MNSSPCSSPNSSAWGVALCRQIKKELALKNGINRFKSQVGQLLAVGTQIRCSTFLNVERPVCKMDGVKWKEMLGELQAEEVWDAGLPPPSCMAHPCSHSWCFLHTPPNSSALFSYGVLETCLLCWK